MRRPVIEKRRDGVDELRALTLRVHTASTRGVSLARCSSARSARVRPGRTLAFGVRTGMRGIDAPGSRAESSVATPDLGPRGVDWPPVGWAPRRDEWIAGRRAGARSSRPSRSRPGGWRFFRARPASPRCTSTARARGSAREHQPPRHCAVAAVSLAPVGVDACDDEDGPRLPRMARRVFDEGEAEACHAHASPETQAAVWALKEAGLKLHGGGILMPGLRTVRVESLEPPRVADPSMRVALYRLPHRQRSGARKPDTTSRPDSGCAEMRLAGPRGPPRGTPASAPVTALEGATRSMARLRR